MNRFERACLIASMEIQQLIEASDQKEMSRTVSVGLAWVIGVNVIYQESNAEGRQMWEDGVMPCVQFEMYEIVPSCVRSGRDQPAL